MHSGEVKGSNRKAASLHHGALRRIALGRKTTTVRETVVDRREPVQGANPPRSVTVMRKQGAVLWLRLPRREISKG